MTDTPSYVQFDSGIVLVGDCLDRLRDLDDASVESVVTDPPYEIGFMGRSWDSTGIAYSVELWEECLRVLKPGGHLLAFGATRSYHRMAVAIEDAGFEIRDSIHWSYGSGFPKSLDVSKAIGKAAGAEREDVYASTERKIKNLVYGKGLGVSLIERRPATPAAQQWQGWGTALKPSHEPIVVARKPLVGTVAENVLEHGTGALNIDGCRVGPEERTYDLTMTSGNFETTGGGKNEKSGTATVSGRWPSNTLLTHAADCADTCAPGCPVPALDQQNDGASRFFHQSAWDPELDAPFIYQAKPSKSERNAGLDGLPEKRPDNRTTTGMGTFDEKGVAKQSNHHPTVKPVALMAYLCRMVTPPGGTVLDPFLGSGTTAVAAVREGFTWVGCEMTADYLPIVTGRITHAENPPKPTTKKRTKTTPAAEQLTLDTP